MPRSAGLASWVPLASCVGAALLVLGGRAHLLLLCAAVLAAGVCCLVPVRWLPSLALVSYVVVPLQALPHVASTVSPAVPLLLAWQVRGRLGDRAGQRRQRAGAPEALALVLAAYLLASRYWTAVPDRHWTISFVLLALVVPALARSCPVGLAELPGTWSVLGGALGAYAVVEKFVLGGNPLSQLYRGPVQVAVEQPWSTYRATTLLQHPLMTATFLSIAAAVGVGLVLRGDRRHLVPVLLSSAGVVATVSRSGIAALVVGVGGCIVVATLRFGAGGRRRLAMLLPAALVLVYFAGSIFAQRTGSSEAVRSSNYRGALRQAGLDAVGEHPLGGFGTGGLRDAAAVAGVRTRGNFENGWLEFILANGLVGAVLLAALLALFAVRALRAGEIEVVGAAASYAVSLGSFNLVAAYRPAHLLLGLLLAMGSVARAVVVDRPAVPAPRPAELPRVAGAGREKGRLRTPVMAGRS